MARSSEAQEFSVAGGRVFIASTKVRDLVVIEGSVLGGSSLVPSALEAVPGLGSTLLDAGTRRKSKTVLRDGLAARGASLSFSAYGARLYFSAKCFPEDLSYLLSLITECLVESALPEAELQASKERALGSLAEEKSDTRARGSRALSGLIYADTHPNYERSIEEEEVLVKKAARKDIQSWQKKLGSRGLVLALAGDVDPSKAKREVEKAFGKLAEGSFSQASVILNSKRAVSREELVPIQGKANVDVYLGAALSLRKLDDAYLPLSVASEMLGGGFASHLMQTVRERDGLTYGTYSRLAGFEDGNDGYWHAWATFSPDLYERGLDTLKKEIRAFKSTQMTADNLEKKKDEIAGSYVIALATTRGLARALHTIGADGRPLSYLYDFPALVRGTTIETVRDAFSLVPLENLALAAAGEFKY